MANHIASTLSDIIEELSGLFARVDGGQAERLAATLQANQGALFVAGAGRSGLLLRCFAMRMMHTGFATHLVGDVTTPAARKGDILLIGSGSGETGSLAALAGKAKRLGVTVALVTASPDSTIAGLTDQVVVVPAPSPKAHGALDSVRSAQPMGNLFEQGMFLLLDALVMFLMRQTGISSERMFERHANLE